MRKLLWLPCTAVLLLSLFAPEIACLATHLSVRSEVVLGKYHIKTPIACIIVGDNKSYLWTFSAPGIARLGIRKYWKRDVPVSEMSFYPIEHPEKQLDKNVSFVGKTVLGKRSIRFGQQSMTCWDLIDHNKFVDSLPYDPTLAEIGCSTDNEDFYANFSGWRGDAPKFYKTLQQITFAD